jgi:hypothetical protein
MIIYLGLLEAKQAVLANLVMPILTTVVEMLSVKTTIWTYTKFVKQARAKTPGCVAGDQRWQISGTLFCACGLTESVRLACLLASAVREPDKYDWVTGMFSAVFINLIIRKGWQANMVSYVAGRVPVLKGLVAHLHTMNRQQSLFKDTAGYPRFFLPLFLIIIRGILYQEFDPAHPQCAFFNWNFATVSLAALFTECSEHFLVNLSVLPEAPFLLCHENHYKKLKQYDLDQAVTIIEGGEGGPRVPYKPGSKRPYLPLNVHGLKDEILGYKDFIGLYQFQYLGAVVAFETLVGGGYLRGYCDFPMTSPVVLMQEMFHTGVPFACV